MTFIISWKVLGEFVSPKNMTSGSQCPNLVLNAAFHFSPFFMRTLLYPCHTSTLEKMCAPLRSDMSCAISGSGYWFRTMWLLSRL
jgi:hypothetical protein